MTELPYAYGTPPLRARLRVSPEDFRVDERLAFELSGSGEHVYVRVRKRDANTAWVAERLAAFAGVAARQVSYAGLKDRHAVTEQWFSIQLPGRAEPDWSRCPSSRCAGSGRGDTAGGFEVVATGRHQRKLRRGAGAISSNIFSLTLRDLAPAAAAVDGIALARRWATISAGGVPNYFGPQRFGRGGANLQRALAMFADPKPRKRVSPDRHRRGLYLSAARAELFNRLLAARVENDSWRTGLAGETLLLAGSNSRFTTAVIDAVLLDRLARADLYTSGPLWGAGRPSSRGVALALELDVAGRQPALAAGLAQAGLDQQRRALRLLPRQAKLNRIDPTTVEVSFELPPGGYATSVLRELVRDTADDPAR